MGQGKPTNGPFYLNRARRKEYYTWVGIYSPWFRSVPLRIIEVLIGGEGILVHYFPVFGERPNLVIKGFGLAMSKGSSR